MADYKSESILDVKHTREIGSQRGGWPTEEASYSGFDDWINSHLALGWRILSTYIEDKDHEHRQECVVLLGWIGDGEPKYPDR